MISSSFCLFSSFNSLILLSFSFLFNVEIDKLIFYSFNSANMSLALLFNYVSPINFIYSNVGTKIEIGNNLYSYSISFWTTFNNSTLTNIGTGNCY